MSIPTLKMVDENGKYKTVKANSAGRFPVVKAWSEDGEAYVPVAAVSGSSGVELPVLTNPGAAKNLESGYQLIDQDGNIVYGKANVLAGELVDGGISNGSTAGGTVDVIYTDPNGIATQSGTVHGGREVWFKTAVGTLLVLRTYNATPSVGGAGRIYVLTSGMNGLYVYKVTGTVNVYVNTYS